ncbi:MAG TPA: SURF1 family protein [Castellaniella sp.]|nr:SURF1 family protein [Castellaniella sp.]
MNRSRRIPARQITALVLLVAVAIVCVMAGQWQLRRGAAREALSAAMLAGSQAAPIVLDTHTREGPDWHTARVHGTWLPRFTVLLDNRNLKGQPGLWVATPLQLQGQPGLAILILRGWLPRPGSASKVPDLTPPQGPVEIHGQILHHVPRLFDLGSITGDAPPPIHFTNQDADPPRVQNLALSDLAQATGLTLLPVILEQAPVADSGLRQEWPGPSLDASQNYGYALQWFSFSIIAVLAALALVWRTWIRPKAPTTAHEDRST